MSSDKSRHIKLFTATQDAKAKLQRRSVVTIGNYDGIHLGHRAILSKVYHEAQSQKCNAVVLSFDPHPVRFLAPELGPRLINTLPQKLELLEKLGMDALVVQKFDKAFAGISPQDFLNKHIAQNLNAAHVIVGHDFTFGSKRSGTTETLMAWGKEHDVKVTIVPPQWSGQVLCSSTAVRHMITAGNVKQAAELLQRPFFIDGTVIHGHRRGASLGIHTANLGTDNDLLPKDGVYATWILVKNELHASVTNIGFNPTFNNTERSIETHIFNFDADIYQKPARLIFVEHLRDEKRFESPELLIKQIRQDITKAKAILAKDKGHA